MTLSARTATSAIIATTSLVAVSLVGGVASAATATTPLPSLQVKAFVLGSAYKVRTIVGGSGLGEVTLQFCGQTLGSDKDRAARLQVQFYPSTDTKPFISEEIVRYKTGDGSAARKDLVTAGKLCPKKISFTNGNGGTTTESNTPATVKGTPKGAIVFKSYFSANDPGKKVSPETSYAFFLTRGDYLIGVYSGTSKADVAAALKIEKAAATKLAAT